MIVKIILIVSSIIGSYYCYSCKIFKNDLGGFDNNSYNYRYDNPGELDRFYREKGQVVNALLRQ